MEKNRSGLQELLRQLIQHPTLRTDPHIIEFLCLTPADPERAEPSPARPSAYAKPAMRHSTDTDDEGPDALDDADTVDAMRPPETAVRNGGRWSESPQQARRAVGPGQQACSEPRGTVWIGEGDFPAP